MSDQPNRERVTEAALLLTTAMAEALTLISEQLDLSAAEVASASVSAAANLAGRTIAAVYCSTKGDADQIKRELIAKHRDLTSQIASQAIDEVTRSRLH